MGPGVGAPPCNKCPHAVWRDASSIHHQPALPPPVSSSALLLLLLPGAELAGSQPWKMLCWKGPEAHAWLLLSGGEWGSQDLTTNKMAFFFSFFFFETVVWRVFVLYFDGFLAGAPRFLRSRGGSQQSREIEVTAAAALDTQRQTHFYSFDSSAEHLALRQRPYRLLFGSLHSGHTPHLKWQTVFYLLPHEFIQFWCNWSGYSTFSSKYSGIVLQPVCFSFPQSTTVTQSGVGADSVQRELIIWRNHMNVLNRISCWKDSFVRPTLAAACESAQYSHCHQSSPPWTSWTVDLIQA